MAKAEMEMEIAIHTDVDEVKHTYNSGYQAAIADVRAAIEDELGIHQRLREQNPMSWTDRYDNTYYVVGRISTRITKLLEDKS